MLQGIRAMVQQRQANAQRFSSSTTNSTVTSIALVWFIAVASTIASQGCSVDANREDVANADEATSTYDDYTATTITEANCAI